MVHAQHVWPGLVYAPERWGRHWRRRPHGTRDGVIPYRVLLAYLPGMSAVMAMARLNLSRAIALAMAGDQAEMAAEATIEEALPG